MGRVRLMCLAIVLAGSAHGSAVSRPSTAVLVELFTSEGCSSCPPADTLLQTLVEHQPVTDVHVIGLGLHVDYWDALGWKDPFSSAALTDRQRRYADRFHVESIYTPQMIVDGRTELVGSDQAAARRAIATVMSLQHGLLTIFSEPVGTRKLRVRVSATELPLKDRGEHADLVLAVTEDGLRSNVRAGENRGRQLAHAAVVRQMTTIGEMTGAEATAHTDLTLASDWQRANLKLVAFVQERTSGHVIATATSAVPSPAH